ncbi:MAG: ATP phosphoribosyltransferase regulatory subunit [Lachnospiraceae bacterium]|nr:ATP phosphoribosyltransferase regulatory subunit [Lachnospiraceae bacterium]MBQ8138119.1 ATP phosphoribosyltransferase regulatory subunit [Lachnospiraceae bacterium]MBR1650495.1 ATP phosphoribosyltransferase regulatory subunit [Lachnospiraceae bacterium]
MNNKLLHTPEGVRDIYGREYDNKAYLEEQLSKIIDSFGYRKVQTPTFEFFDVFSKEVGTIPSNELYKFFDKENNTLVLRPDFTPSIARCAAKYFCDSNEPLRLSYLGSAFTRTDSLQGKLEESTQLGAEFIGDDSVFADGEVIALSINCLKEAGLKDFRVSVGHIGYFKGLCEEAGIDDETELELRKLISGKNYFAAQELIEEKEIASPYKEKLLGIADSFNDLDSLQAAGENVGSERSVKALERLEQLYKVLCSYGVEKYVSFDLGMLSKYNYYTGVIFRVYTYGLGRAIVKGGRYDNLLMHFGKNAPAIGFGLQIDDILEALSSQNIALPLKEEPTYIIYNPDDLEEFSKALKKAEELRSLGKSVILNSKTNP